MTSLCLTFHLLWEPFPFPSELQFESWVFHNTPFSHSLKAQVCNEEESTHKLEAVLESVLYVHGVFLLFCNFINWDVAPLLLPLSPSTSTSIHNDIHSKNFLLLASDITPCCLRYFSESVSNHPRWNGKRKCHPCPYVSSPWEFFLSLIHWLPS